VCNNLFLNFAEIWCISLNFVYGQFTAADRFLNEEAKYQQGLPWSRPFLNFCTASRDGQFK
ncbi:hypothetical protein KI387_014106, partial [Taxus chinensis]